MKKVASNIWCKEFDFLIKDIAHKNESIENYKIKGYSFVGNGIMSNFEGIIYRDNLLKQDTISFTYVIPNIGRTKLSDLSVYWSIDIPFKGDKKYISFKRFKKLLDIAVKEYQQMETDN